MADAHGRRRTLIAVAALSAVTSALCAFARGYWVRPPVIKALEHADMASWHRLPAMSICSVASQYCQLVTATGSHKGQQLPLVQIHWANRTMRFACRC